jgi:hypothetical protein
MVDADILVAVRDACPMTLVALRVPPQNVVALIVVAHRASNLLVIVMSYSSIHTFKVEVTSVPRPVLSALGLALHKIWK